jgi:membrane-associated protease RseP (regulator of RpoE activity)
MQPENIIWRIEPVRVFFASLQKGGSTMSQVSETVCSNCNSTMPAELRFCRNCGFRLTGSTGSYTGSPYPDSAVADSAAVPRKKRRLSGMSWIFVGLLVFFVGAAAFTALVAPLRKTANIVQRAAVVKSYIGVDGFDTSDQGVYFEAVTTPGGPADQAGLVGGDVILKFDGQPVQNEDQIEDLMTKTPVGKTVEIEYMRDGEKKTTKLTTISMEENRRLTREFERRPEGRAHFGYEDGDAERVQVPGSNIYGVKLGTVLRSRPADLAGVKEGDIITAIDGVPIRTSDELLMRVRRALPYSTVKLSIVRKGENESDPIQKLEIPVKMGKQ